MHPFITQLLAQVGGFVGWLAQACMIGYAFIFLIRVIVHGRGCASKGVIAFRKILILSSKEAFAATFSLEWVRLIVLSYAIRSFLLWVAPRSPVQEGWSLFDSMYPIGWLFLSISLLPLLLLLCSWASSWLSSWLSLRKRTERKGRE